MRTATVALGLALLAACHGGAPGTGATPSDIEGLIAAGEVRAAESAVRQSIRDEPEDPALRLLLGQVYLAAGDGAAARSAFGRARSLGAAGPAVLAGLVDSFIATSQWNEVLRLLPVTGDRAALPVALIEKRLQALLRTPLARPAELFGDARHLLLSQATGAGSLERMTAADGVIAGNAEHVDRAFAYWSCRAMPATAVSPPPPAWANLAADGRRLLAVGPAHELKAPSDAARIAEDGDIIEIDAGTWRGDVAQWRASDLWIRAKDGKVTLIADGASAGDMGTWIIRGNNTIVEGIRFEGARALHKNGSGIRLLAHNLWLRHAEFHDNEAGLLTFNEPGGEVRVEHSVFTENGAGDGYSHNVYIGRTDRLVFRFNYSAGVRIGHQLKSRARENIIAYNRLGDEEAGNSSYTIDLPEGGLAVVVGNELQQGPRTVNRHMISLGAEVPEGTEHRFIFAHNTFYNGTSPATFIRDATATGVALVNNVFAGAPAELDTSSTTRTGNAFDANLGLQDPRAQGYALKPAASFIDTGETVESLYEQDIVPRFEYVHPAGAKIRRTVWRPDPGAHEFCGWPEYAAS